jgi:hypothetical protein
LKPSRVLKKVFPQGNRTKTFFGSFFLLKI